MAKKRKREEGGVTSEWLNTYADMVTLLLTFFILLYSMSTLDSAKFSIIVRAFADNIESAERIVIDGTDEFDEIGGMPPMSEEALEEIYDLEDIFNVLSDYIDQNGLSDSVEVSMGDGYVFIRFMNDMLFEPNSSRLKQADLEILNFVGYGIKSVQSKAEIIRIDGHTAAIPDDPEYAVSDRILSSERANMVLMYFEDEIGIDPSKLVQVGFGKWMPFTHNDDEEHRQMNRRVEILISGQNIIGNELDAIYEKLIE